MYLDERFIFFLRIFTFGLLIKRRNECATKFNRIFEYIRVFIEVSSLNASTKNDYNNFWRTNWFMGQFNRFRFNLAFWAIWLTFIARKQYLSFVFLAACQFHFAKMYKFANAIEKYENVSHRERKKCCNKKEQWPIESKHPAIEIKRFYLLILFSAFFIILNLLVGR